MKRNHEGNMYQMYTNIFLKNNIFVFLRKNMILLQLKIIYAKGTKPLVLSILKVSPGNLIWEINAIL